MKKERDLFDQTVKPSFLAAYEALNGKYSQSESGYRVTVYDLKLIEHCLRELADSVKGMQDVIKPHKKISYIRYLLTILKYRIYRTYYKWSKSWKE